MMQTKMLGASLIMLAGIGGFMFSNNLKDADKELSLEQRPIINQEAAKDYKSGRISKDTAATIIDKQLDELVSVGNLTDWTYSESIGRYDITLVNGTKFAYYLN